MVHPLDGACRSAGKGARLAALLLGVLSAIAPAGALGSTISQEFSGASLHRDWRHFVHGFDHVKDQILPRHAHKATGTAAHPAAEVAADAPLPSTQQVHAAAMVAHSDRITSTTVTPHVRITAVNGLLPQNAMVSYLETRRGLDPARFDSFHPKLGAMLAEDEALRATQPVTTAKAPATPAAQVATPTRTVHFAADNVPEPGTATIALTLIGAVALARRFRRRLS